MILLILFLNDLVGVFLLDLLKNKLPYLFWILSSINLFLIDFPPCDDYYHCSNIGPCFAEYKDIHQNANPPEY